MMYVMNDGKKYELAKDITLRTLADSEACINGVAEFLRNIPLSEITTIHTHHKECVFCRKMLDRIAADRKTFLWLLLKGFFKTSES